MTPPPLETLQGQMGNGRGSLEKYFAELKRGVYRN